MLEWHWQTQQLDCDVTRVVNLIELTQQASQASFMVILISKGITIKLTGLGSELYKQMKPIFLYSYFERFNGYALPLTDNRVMFYCPLTLFYNYPQVIC